MVTDVQKGPTLSIWLHCPIIQTVEKPVLSCLETQPLLITDNKAKKPICGSQYFNPRPIFRVLFV